MTTTSHENTGAAPSIEELNPGLKDVGRYEFG